jgi:drug/metabolite transporter (DMT)-like permease
MDKLSFYYIILVLSVFIASLSQVLLKKSAQKVYAKKTDEYLNPLVIIAYSIFFLTTLINLMVMKHIPLSYVPIIESMGYVFIAILGRGILKEKLNKKKVFGMLFILLGIMIFSM